MQASKSPIEQIQDFARTLIDAVIKDGPTITLAIVAPGNSLVIADGALALAFHEGKFYLDKAERVDDYPYGPSYTDAVEVGSFATVAEAAHGVLMAVAELLYTRCCDRLADEAMAREIAEEEHIPPMGIDRDGEDDYAWAP